MAHIIYMGNVIKYGVPIVELAIEHYMYIQTFVGFIVKTYKGKKMYLREHIDQLCDKEEPIFKDTYAIRTKGYYTVEETLAKISQSEKGNAKNIQTIIHNIHNSHEKEIAKVLDDMITIIESENIEVEKNEEFILVDSIEDNTENSIKDNTENSIEDNTEDSTENSIEDNIKDLNYQQCIIT